MSTCNIPAGLASDGIWLISAGRRIENSHPPSAHAEEGGAFIEYDISELACYLLDPGAVEIHKKLVGAAVHYRPFASPLKEKLRRTLPPALHRFIGKKIASPELILSELDERGERLKNASLESHFNTIYAALKPYDTVARRLAQLDRDVVTDLEGVCRDAGGTVSRLTLAGSLDEKIAYINDHLLLDVPVVLPKAHLSEGLFDMGGFDFTAYNPDQSHRLVKCRQNGKTGVFVRAAGDRIRFWVEDIKLVYYIQILEQIVRANPQLREAMVLCTRGEATALTLYFKTDLGIEYNAHHIPPIYRDAFAKHNIAPQKIEILTDVLKNRQSGILFHYIPETRPASVRSFTNLSVLHNLKALEPIRNELPGVYAEIDARAVVTEVGRFYLLESRREYAR